MKTICLIIFLSMSFLNAEKLTQEFLEGCESGFSLRNNEEAFKDFNCPKPETRQSALNIISHWITPLKLLLGLKMKSE